MAIIVILFFAFIILYIVSKFIYKRTDFLKIYFPDSKNKWVTNALNDISEVLECAGLIGIIINACLLLWGFLSYLISNGILLAMVF